MMAKRTERVLPFFIKFISVNGRRLANVQKNSESNMIHRNRLTRRALIVVGTFFVGIGILGIFLPVLPTTPFFLLAAACYARSSEKCYRWLLNHHWFGKYIGPYREGKGIPLKAKAISISLVWLTILSSVFLLVHLLFVKIILLVIAGGVTLYLLSLPTFRE